MCKKEESNWYIGFTTDTVISNNDHHAIEQGRSSPETPFTPFAAVSDSTGGHGRGLLRHHRLLTAAVNVFIESMFRVLLTLHALKVDRFINRKPSMSTS